MKTRAAVLRGVGRDWEVVDVEVDSPKAGEVVVEWMAAGLCHSDEHMITGDMVPPEEAWEALGIESLWPMIGGHEGAGVIAEVGPGAGGPVGQAPGAGAGFSQPGGAEPEPESAPQSAKKGGAP